MNKLFLLFAGHALADFALQNDFVAKFKARGSADFWFWVLLAHSLIHGGIVYFITQNIWLGIIETLAHGLIDFGKCEKKYGFNTDQALHYTCKVIYALV